MIKREHVEAFKTQSKGFVDRGEHWTHALYCAALFLEGHGFYALIGGVLGVFVILHIFVGWE